MYGYPEQFIPQPEYSTGLPELGGAPPPVAAPGGGRQPDDHDRVLGGLDA